MDTKSLRVTQKIVDYQKVFSSEEGKRVLFDMMKAGHMTHSSFDKLDAYGTAFREGERNMVLRIMTILKQDANQIAQRMREGELDERE